MVAGGEQELVEHASWWSILAGMVAGRAWYLVGCSSCWGMVAGGVQ